MTSRSTRRVKAAGHRGPSAPAPERPAKRRAGGSARRDARRDSRAPTLFDSDSDEAPAASGSDEPVVACQLIEDVFVCCTRFLRMYFHCVSSRLWPSPLKRKNVLIAQCLSPTHREFPTPRKGSQQARRRSHNSWTQGQTRRESLHHARILLDGLDVGIHRGASRRTASA